MKKLNKLVAILVAMAMVLALSIVSAFAADYKEGTEALALSKTLTMPAGTTTPTASYTFTFVQDTENANAEAVAIAPITLSFAATDEGTTSGDTKTVTKTWMDVLKDAEFETPGLYIYNVTETAGGTSATNGKVTETYENSQAQYKISVLVDKDGNVTDVAAQQIKEDDGTDSPDADKVDPNAPDDQEDEDDDNIGDKTDVSADGTVNFTNNYFKTVNNDPEGKDDDEDAGSDNDSLYVEKEVVADADYLDANKDFKFTIAITFPAKTDTAAYTAKVVNADGTDASPAQALTFTRADDSSLEQEFTLKHGQRLVFTKIDVGATYTVDEDEYANYTTTGEVADATRVTDALANGTKVVNTYDYSTDTPTGILINNLPYIALALVAIGGLVAYVVVRRRDNENA